MKYQNMIIFIFIISLNDSSIIDQQLVFYKVWSCGISCKHVDLLCGVLNDIIGSIKDCV